MAELSDGPIDRALVYSGMKVVLSGYLFLVPGPGHVCSQRGAYESLINPRTYCSGYREESGNNFDVDIDLEEDPANSMGSVAADDDVNEVRHGAVGWPSTAAS